jgi:sugar O-acyltransferase (sialic acid O-acetyltransferase NeuD family)
MTQPVVIIGGGGHARVVIDALRASGRTVLGACDPKLAPGSSLIYDVTVLGGDDALAAFDIQEVELANGVGSIGRPRLRRDIFERFLKRGFSFTTVVHPSAAVAADVILKPGAQVMAGAVVQTGATIGADTIINSSASIDHDCRIGAHNHIAPGVTLSGNVTTGEAVHIGTGACVIQSISIGDFSFVAAGTVVTTDLPDNSNLRPGGSWDRFASKDRG